MSKTYRKQLKTGVPPRELLIKRPKQALQSQIDEDLEELKRLRSPLYAWERDRQSELER